ncbi:xanthine dehydrogenase accessory protein XdhC [Sphingobium aquiterrae]|uniref:xanthine dehydrogenase accessory protein XdhC n=1 Tax=Sphingobium aquiterrae TaxID=2038656 RepID=UPI00301602F5
MAVLDWAEEALRGLARGPTAMVTVLATEGSAPRGPGTRMVVTATGLSGSIGGGMLEYRATEQARAILAHPPGSWRVQDYPLGPLLGQCCGGKVRLLVERLDDDAAAWLNAADFGTVWEARFEEGRIARARLGPDAAAAPPSARDPRPAPGMVLAERLGDPPRPVIMLGAGHVGQAIARAAHGLPLAFAWYDSRAEAADIAGVTYAREDQMIAAIAAAPDDVAVLILTHDHGLDFRLVQAALARPFAFTGVIGSATKRARFRSRLATAGVGEAALSRMVCPIGMPGIGGKQPEVIAIAVLAQLLALKDDAKDGREGGAA